MGERRVLRWRGVWLDLGLITHARNYYQASVNLLPIQADFVTERVKAELTADFPCASVNVNGLQLIIPDNVEVKVQRWTYSCI